MKRIDNVITLLILLLAFTDKKDIAWGVFGFYATVYAMVFVNTFVHFVLIGNKDKKVKND